MAIEAVRGLREDAADATASAVAMASEVARSVAAPRAEVIDQQARWPSEAFDALRAEGLTGLLIPTAHGGLGLGVEALARVCEVLAQSCGSTALCFAMHGVASAVLAHDPSSEQIDRFLVPIAEGRHIATLALSEPGTGAQFWFPQSTAELVGDTIELNGVKDFVTNGGHAHTYVVSARDSDGDGLPSFSCYAVPGDVDGLAWGDVWVGLGMRGNSSRSVRLDGTSVPASAVLGQRGDQTRYVFGIVSPVFLVAMAGTYLGIARSALDAATDHLSHRVLTHTGRPLSSVQVLQHRIGELWCQIERARAQTYRAGRRIDAGHDDATLHAAAAKIEASRTVVEVANEAMTLQGGAGYRESSALDRCLRDARAAPVMSPTTDLLKTWIGRSALGLPMLADP